MTNSPDLKNIKNIIFDFGRVLLNIDPLLTQKAFMNFGFKSDEGRSGRKDDEVVILFESGKITSEEFIATVKDHTDDNVTDQMIIDAWNAMLLDFPAHHVETLKSLKGKYNLYLLSNSTQIHFDRYISDFKDVYGFELSSLFNKMWFSFNIGLVKPDVEIFKFVLNDESLKPEETLFIDDTLVHVKAAQSLNINVYHLKDNEDVSDLFD